VRGDEGSGDLTEEAGLVFLTCRSGDGCEGAVGVPSSLNTPLLIRTNELDSMWSFPELFFLFGFFFLRILTVSVG